MSFNKCFYRGNKKEGGGGVLLHYIKAAQAFLFGRKRTISEGKQT